MERFTAELWALGTVLLALIGREIRRRLVDRRRAVDERRAAPRNLARMRIIRQRLGELAGELGAQRSILLQVSNGGKVPRPGCAMFVTISDEWKSVSMPSVLGLYERRPLRDPHYERLLLRVDREKILLVHTAELPEGSLLRDAYEAAQLVSSWVFAVKYGAGVMHYVSVSSRLELDDTPSARDVIRSYAGVLCHLLTKELSRTDDVLDIDD